MDTSVLTLIVSASVHILVAVSQLIVKGSGRHTAIVTTLNQVTRMSAADHIRSQPMRPLMAKHAHQSMALLNAVTKSAASLWTVLETGVPTALASMIPMITRTGAAETMPSAQTRPTMVTDVLTLMPTSSVPRRAVPSLWTAWELGKSMAHVFMMRIHTRTRSAAPTL